MQITHVNFARGFRGGERQTFNLIEGLTAFGIEQRLVCRPGAELQQRIQASGLAVTTVPHAHPLLGHWGAAPANLIHVHEARGAYWAYIEHAVRKTPYVITRRVPNSISTSALTHKVYRQAERLFGVSQDVSGLLSRQTGCGVNTILSSMTPHVPQPDKVAEIRQTLGGGPIIGHVGALYDHHKGQSVLIQAFHKVTQVFPEARLLLLGEGPNRASFEALAKSDRRICFAGYQQDIGSWMGAIDIFCFPSREEGLGSSVLDAMALGIPVLASTVGGLPELIGRDERGLLVEGHDPEIWSKALQQVMNDRVSSRVRAEAARQFANQKGIGTMTKAYLAAYNDILGNCQANPAIA